MLQVLETLLQKFGAHCYERGIKRAIALHLHGEVRRDGLNLGAVTTHLDIEWRARDIHPWDRGLLSPSERANAFVEQALADTEAAIHRLFAALAQVDTITLKVREFGSERLIISGTVFRPSTSDRSQELSIGMRLRYLGVTYHSAGSLFEALEEDHRPADPGLGCGAVALRSEHTFARATCRDEHGSDRLR
jgi:hypothetical protein